MSKLPCWRACSVRPYSISISILCLSRVVEKDLNFGFFHSENSKSMQRWQLFRLQIHGITASWEVILDVRCVGWL